MKLMEIYLLNKNAIQLSRSEECISTEKSEECFLS